MKKRIITRLLRLYLVGAMIAVPVGTMPAFAAEVPPATDIPSEKLTRERKAIESFIGFAANKLKEGQLDLAQNLCNLAQDKVIAAYVNNDLAKLKIPAFRDRLTEVKKGLLGNITLGSRIDRLQTKLTELDSKASALERTLQIFRRDQFSKKCPDSKKLDEFLGDRDRLIKDPAKYQEYLGKLITSENISVAGPIGAPTPSEPQTPTSKLLGDIYKDVPGAQGRLRSALVNEDVVHPDDINKVLSAITSRDCRQIKLWFDKYPKSKILAQAVMDCAKNSEGTSSGGTSSGGTSPGGTSPGGTSPGGTSPGGTSPGGTSSGGTSPGGTSSGGTSSEGVTNIIDITNGDVYYGGRIVKPENIPDPYSLIETTEGKSGVLTGEIRISGAYVKKGNVKEFVPDSKPAERVEWGFILKQMDDGAGFELADNLSDTTSEYKGFEVQEWTVTDPAMGTQILPESGPTCSYKMKTQGEYKIEAKVKTKLGTVFTIFTKILYSPGEQ